MTLAVKVALNPNTPNQPNWKHQQMTKFNVAEMMNPFSDRVESIVGKEKMLVIRIFSFLAPLAKGQRPIVMALCPLCVRPCIRKLFL